MTACRSGGARRFVAALGVALLAATVFGKYGDTAIAAIPQNEPGQASIAVQDPISLCTTDGLTDRGSIVGVLDLPPGDYSAIECSLRVEVGASFVIPAGVKIIFGEGERLSVEGSLSVQGASSGDVIFTSDRPVKSPGDWDGIRIGDDPGASALIRGATIEFSEDGIVSEAMSTTIENSLISDASRTGINFDGISGAIRGVTIERVAAAGIEVEEGNDALVTVEISNTTIKNSGEPGAILADANIQLELSGNSASDNAINAVVLEDGNIEYPNTWRAGDFPLFLKRGVVVRSDLTIEPGAVLKFGSGSDLTINEEGSLTAVGTAESTIWMTSIADDICRSATIDCDTDNDGPGSPAPGAWDGIDFNVRGNGGTIQHAEIKLSDDAVSINSEGVSILDTLITRSAGHAITVEDVESEIVRNRLVDNAGDGVNVSTDDASITLTLQDNVFEGNTNAVRSDGDVELDTSGNTVPGFTNDRNGYVVSGSLVFSHTWRAGDLPFIPLGNLRLIDANAVLTLAPGLIVKSDEGARINAEEGRLIIGELDGEPVLMTSVLDDACSITADSGCDTNGDGGESRPTRGSWGNIAAEDTSRGLFIRNTVIRYAGSLRSKLPTILIENDATEVLGTTITDGKGAGIDVLRAAPTIEDNIIRNNEGAGIIIDGDGSPLSVSLSRNTIEDNGQDLPLSESVGAIEIDANVELLLDGSNSAGRTSRTSRQLNAIIVSGVVRNSLRWRAGRLPYVVKETVDVQLEKRLTLDPGVVLKFGPRGFLRTSRGTLSAVGTPDAPIIFTSLADARPEAGGETDPDLGDPSPGDWGGLEINEADVCESDTGVCARLQHIEVRYSGLSKHAAIEVNQKLTLISDSLIADGLDAGIFVLDATGVEIRDTTIERIQTIGIVADLKNSESAEITLQGNTIVGAGTGIRIDADVQPRLGLDTDETGNSITESRINGILVEGKLDKIRRWPAGDEIYVMSGEVEINTGSLTLAPGVVLKADIEAELIVDRGSIAAEYDQDIGGVLFTSLRHDTCGDIAGAGTCDTNSDAGSTEAELGDWEGILIRSGATSAIFDGMELLYGGRDKASLVIEHSNTAVRDSEIRFSLNDGVHIESAAGIVFSGNHVADNLGAGLVLDDDASGRLEGNVFTGNGRSIHHKSEGRIDSLGNIAIGNVADPMLYCADVTESQRWASDLAREVSCTVRITGNSSLEIDPGSLVRFADGTALEVKSNTLRAKGVVFTSGENGSVAGFWRGIIYKAGSGGFIEHSLLAYGGGSAGVVHIETNGVEIENNMLLRNLKTGISLEDDVSAVVNGNVIRTTLGPDGTAIRLKELGNTEVKNNRIDDVDLGVDVDDHLPKIQFNNFSGVRTFGVVNDSDENCIEARWNWWGNASGPYDRSGGEDDDDRCKRRRNDDGTGVASSDFVGYEPWLTIPPPSVPMVELPRCGFSNTTAQAVVGRAASGEQVRVYDGTRELATGTADSSGRFSVAVSLDDGEHELSVETFAPAGTAPEELRSARNGFRLVTVDSSQIIDPASIVFTYGPSGSQRAQPLRDETGCASACGGPSAGRVALPQTGDVVVSLRASGSPGSIEFVQPGAAPVALTSGAGGLWSTSAFRPQQGTFTLNVDGGDAGFCDGYVFIGGKGRVFSDQGAPGDPVAYWDFESEPTGLAFQPSWARDNSKAYDGRFSVTDSPDGNSLRDKETALAFSTPLDMRKTVAPSLRFWHSRRIGPGDEARVEAKTCFVCDWDELQAWDDVEPTWQFVEISLEEYARRPELYIRFVVETDDEEEDDGWRLDNIEVGNGGRGNQRYDAGEPLMEGASITLFQRSPETGEFTRWDPGPTGQRNPQSTDAEGRYGFYALPHGEYRVRVQNIEGMEPLFTSPLVITTGVFDGDLPLRRARPVYFPITTKGRWP